MNRIANYETRVYRSDLRLRQAGETRARILDAAALVMASGLSTISIPAVAREAGVSIPTVYRHFGTKRDLLAAVYPHVVRRSGVDAVAPPKSVDELREGVLALFGRLESLDDVGRAAMASPAAEEARRLSKPARVALGHQIADSIVPKLSSADRDRIARLLVVLVTSSSWRMWHDYLDASVEVAADDIDWVVRAAIAASSSEHS